jgi:hypothetical protein
MDIYVDNISICQIPKIFKNGFLQLDNGHDNELCINFYIDIYHIEWNKWKQPIWDNISYEGIHTGVQMILTYMWLCINKYGWHTRWDSKFKY